MTTSTDLDPATTNASPESEGLRLSVEEVAHLCALLDLSGPPDAERSAAWHTLSLSSTEQVKALRAVISRALLARGVLSVQEDGSLLVDESVAALCRLLSTPGLVIRIQCGDAEGELTAVSTAYATPDEAVREAQGWDGVNSYHPLPVASLLEWVIDATGLGNQRVPEAALEMSIPLRVLVRAGERQSEGDIEQGVCTLTDGGASEPCARAYLLSLADHVGSRAVTTTHRCDGVLTTSVTAWTDCGPSGLWMVRQDDATTDTFTGPGSEALTAELLELRTTINAVGTADLTQRIAAGLP